MSKAEVPKSTIYTKEGTLDFLRHVKRKVFVSDNRPGVGPHDPIFHNFPTMHKQNLSLTTKKRAVIVIFKQRLVGVPQGAPQILFTGWASIRALQDDIPEFTLPHYLAGNIEVKLVKLKTGKKLDQNRVRSFYEQHLKGGIANVASYDDLVNKAHTYYNHIPFGEDLLVRHFPDSFGFLDSRCYKLYGERFFHLLPNPEKIRVSRNLCGETDEYTLLTFNPTITKAIELPKEAELEPLTEHKNPKNSKKRRDIEAEVPEAKRRTTRGTLPDAAPPEAVDGLIRQMVVTDKSPRSVAPKPKGAKAIPAVSVPAVSIPQVEAAVSTTSSSSKPDDEHPNGVRKVVIPRRSELKSAAVAMTELSSAPDASEVHKLFAADAIAVSSPVSATSPLHATPSAHPAPSVCTTPVVHTASNVPTALSVRTAPNVDFAPSVCTIRNVPTAVPSAPMLEEALPLPVLDSSDSPYEQDLVTGQRMETYFGHWFQAVTAHNAYKKLAEARHNEVQAINFTLMAPVKAKSVVTSLFKCAESSNTEDLILWIYVDRLIKNLNGLPPKWTQVNALFELMSNPESELPMREYHPDLLVALPAATPRVWSLDGIPLLQFTASGHAILVPHLPPLVEYVIFFTLWILDNRSTESALPNVLENESIGAYLARLG